MKTIKWSSQAENTYDKIIEGILLKWNDDIAKSFILEVEELLVKLSEFNKLCPKSKIQNTRKCVVSKQTSLVYKIQRKSIYLITFITNTTNHKF